MNEERASSDERHGQEPGTLMRRLLRRHDFVYERAANQWLEGIPLANGQIGAMVWGCGAPLVFTLDSYDIYESRTDWPGEDPRFTWANLRRLKEEGRIEELHEVALRRRSMRFTDQPPPHPSRIPLGRMELRWPHSAEGFNARLSLSRALATGTLTFAEGDAAFAAFVCSTRDVLVVTVRCDPGLPLPEVDLVPAPVDAFSQTHLRSWGYPDPEVRKEPGRTVLSRRYSEGKEYSVIVEEARRTNTLTLFLTIASGDEGSETEAEGLERVAAARRKGRKALRSEHEADWRGFWEKSALQIPDSRLENLYYAELYKHYCSSRAGHLPIPIQGLWTTDGVWPPWRGNYTTDMNVQECYWMVYASNHLDSGTPVYEMYWRNLPHLRRIGRYFYGKEIAVVPSEHGPGCESFPGYFTEEHSPGNGAWIAHLFWLHWLYSQDTAFLRDRAYPFIREMAQAYLHIAEKREDGKYHIPFTDTPEFWCGRPESMGDDSSYDLALFRFLLEALLSAQDELPERDADCGHWEMILANLADDPLAPSSLYRYERAAFGPNEQIPDPAEHLCLALRPDEPLPHSHRHHSHLIGIHPLGVIDPDRSEAERRLVDKSLEDLVFQGTGEWMGWSFAWASLIALRAGRTRMAHHYLRTYADGFIVPNSFHINDSDEEEPNGICARLRKAMTLEGGFAAAAAILETLLQSHHGILRVFPACGPTWADAQFLNLRAEGAFVVSARMKNYEVLFVDVLSEAGRPCRIRDPFGEGCIVSDLTYGRARELGGDVLSFSTKPGGRYRLTRTGSPLADQDVAFQLAKRPRGEQNWFGLKTHPRF